MRPSNLTDPLAALQTSVQAAFPTHPQIRHYLRRLDGNPLQLWARLYAVVFPAYGLAPRPGKSGSTSLIYIRRSPTVSSLRACSHDSLERLTGGEDVLSAVILGMIPDLFMVERHDVELLAVRTLPDESIDWLERHDWEEAEDR